MNLKKELRIIVKYISPKEEHDVIENYVDSLALINRELLIDFLRKYTKAINNEDCPDTAESIVILYEEGNL